MQKGRERRGWPDGLATWRLASGGSTAGAVDRGWGAGPPVHRGPGAGRASARRQGADRGGDAMDARLQLAVAALRGTGNDGEGTGVLHGPRRARCACCGDRKRPGRTGRGEGRFGGGGGALELKRWRRL